MDKLTVLIKEHVAIVKHLQKTGECILSDKGRVLLVTKGTIVGMLNKSPYLPAAEKLENWRALGWILSDENRYTKRRYVDGAYKRFVLLNLESAQALAALMVPMATPDTTQTA